MSSCSGKCGCGSDCKCGSGCGCGMYPTITEQTTTVAIISGVAPVNVAFAEMGFEAAECNGNGCKCGSNCSCTSCNCN